MVILRVAYESRGDQDGDMGEIVNLRRVKKARQRAAEAEAARQNRVRHGRTAAEKANDDRARQRQAQAIDAARLDEKPA
jgi:hypothetical protein